MWQLPVSPIVLSDAAPRLSGYIVLTAASGDVTAAGLAALGGGVPAADGALSSEAVPPLSLTVVYMPLMTSQLGSLLSEEEYQRRMVPCLVKLFSSPDRATRVKLLQQLETFVDHLQPGTVNDQVRQTYPGGGGEDAAGGGPTRLGAGMVGGDVDRVGTDDEV